MSCSLRDNLLVTMGARASSMDSLGYIELPDGSRGEDILAIFCCNVVDEYLVERHSPEMDCISFDEYIETALTKEFHSTKQYHVRVHRVYEFFVEANNREEASEEAERNYFEHSNGIADECWVEIVDSYAAPGTE